MKYLKTFLTQLSLIFLLIASILVVFGSSFAVGDIVQYVTHSINGFKFGFLGMLLLWLAGVGTCIEHNI